ncbi:MAG: 4-hydroxy-3-methylbut-2-enyl diphosphate reductase, partial [Clostridia bacterium]|nr:4-hydroxy-3-methylbut-2-enyl diphosphate reductase [Clostridia bacterium]
MVVLGKYNGFCSGVKRAVDTAKKIGGEGVYILGELIHNKDVVDEITALGVKQIEDVDEIDKGTLIIRSHGVGKDIYDRLAEKKDVTVVDCTCPFVKKIHKIVSDYSKKGYYVIIVGEKAHPEVAGIVGWCDGQSEVTTVFDEKIDYGAHDKVCIVAQTTCSVEKFDGFVQNFLKSYTKNIAIFKTICYTTMERQHEADVLSRSCDAMIVIGGEKSSNTKKLYDICRKNCQHVFLINSAKAFDGSSFCKFKRIGIVSGASTPPEQSQEVFSKMEEITEVKTEVEVTEGETATEEVKAEQVEATETAPAAEEAADQVETTESAPVAEEAPADEAPAAAEVTTAPESKNVMEEAVAQMPTQKFRKGQRIKATISSATDEGLALYINGTKKEILLPKEEVNCDSYNKADFDGKIGDEIEVMITNVNPVMLSEKQIVRLVEEEKEIEDIKAGKIFEVVVDGTNKGGLTARFGSYGVFIPSSQIRIGFVKELDKYVGKTLRLKAEKVESQERRKQIVASQRVILESERAEKEAAR